MLVHVTDIVWDTEGEKVRGLPKKMLVEVDDDLLVGWDDYVEVVSYTLDKASDETGWLISDSNLRAEVKSAPDGFDVRAFNKHCRS